MHKLIDVIRFEGKHYEDVSAEGQRQIIHLAEKLKSLEHKLVWLELPNINIQKGETVFLSFIPETLKQEIYTLLSTG